MKLKYRTSPRLPKSLVSLIVSFTLAFSLVPSAAFAEATAPDMQAAADAQAVSGSGSSNNGAATAQSATGTSNALTVQGLTAQALNPVNETVQVTVGLPSESNTKKDIYVDLTYKDDFFAGSSANYNDDLAYASVCLASAAINSNEGTYPLKSKNIVSLLQQIGCKDIELNGGYKAAPGELANIGVAIGYKDIRVDGKNCRLFVIGVRGSNYEKEWAANMRVGLEGDAQGFHEARDGVIGFIMPYMKEHTADLPANTTVKVWGSGYCRGGTTLNLVFGWLNKWVYERNNGHTYNNLAYNSCYNADHSVVGAAYDKSQLRYTQSVSFPTDYISSNAVFSNDDLYAYPVNCPFSADATDVENYEGLMTGFHNLINPEDWFPQIVMDWWGFKRYGYTHDHDITGTYPQDGTLHARNKSVWDPSDGSQRYAAVTSMLNRLKAVDSETAIHDAFFRQYYFSKTGTIVRGIAKAGTWIWNKIMPKSLEVAEPNVFTATPDEKGEGNVFKSQGREMKYNQGAYYEEFLKFLIDAAGIRSDSAAHAREDYVNNYQDAFEDMAGWLMGSPLAVREKLGETASRNMKSSLTQVCQTSDNYILKMTSILWTDKVGTIVSYTFAAIWAMNDENASIISSLLSTTLTKTFKALGISYTNEKVERLSKVLGRLAYRFYDNEQKIGKFNFYHAMTMMQAGSSIAQAHWPEQSLAWFSQCKPGKAEKIPKTTVQTQAQSQSQSAGEPSSALATQAADEPSLTTQADTEHQIFASFEDDPNVFYDCDTRDNGEIIGTILPSDMLRREGYAITSWNMYRFEDFPAAESMIGTVDENYVLSASDPDSIVLTPNYEALDSKHVNLWLNAPMTGFDQDKKIAEFDVYDGGSTYIAYSLLPDGISEDGFDVVYYGDNPNLLDWEGLSLEGWVNAAESEDDLISFLPDDNISYIDLPYGDVVDLYALWYDPVVYGVTYHANRSATDSYQVEDASWAPDGKLTVQGFTTGDEGLNNPGMKFVGWNTKADGSGTSFSTGDVATLDQLGLGTREGYLSDLEELSALQIEAAPSHASDTVDTSAADALEAQLVDKYTTHLYGQWEKDDGAAKQDNGTAAKPTPSNRGTTSTPSAKTGDTIPVGLVVLLAFLAVLALGVALGIRKRARR